MNMTSASTGSFDNLPTAGQTLVKTFPRLFKKASSGAIQYWDIFAQQSPAGYGLVVTIYGQLGTPNPQRTSDTVSEGKNLGKKNATTAYEQAIKQAQGKWEKQKKNKGYVDTEEAARAELVDSTVGGGTWPMLAEKYRDYAKKVAWPCFVQPKLNGHRCIATVVGGKATLWSRKRKPITSMPHIIAELEANFTDAILDGELYNQEIGQTSPDYTGPKTPDAMTLQELSGLVRSKVPKGRYEKVQYHVYDLVNDGKFVDRYDQLTSLMSQVNFQIVCLVQTGWVNDDAAVTKLFDEVRSAGYEGLMLRNADGLYIQHPTKRSKDLLKVKKFVGDQEFEIIGIEEGNGKLQGHVGSFVCKAANGNVFKAKLEGEYSFLKECFEDHSLWEGKMLTVEYSELTPEDQVPFQGVGKDIRDKE